MAESNADREAERFGRVADLLAAALADDIARDMGGHVGDQIHALLKRHCTMMNTVAGAVAVGLLAACQVIGETREFVRLSMEGDVEGEQVIVANVDHLFAALLKSSLDFEFKDHAAGFPPFASPHAGEAAEHDPRAFASPDRPAGADR